MKINDFSHEISTMKDTLKTSVIVIVIITIFNTKYSILKILNNLDI
jgi:hypothetical protein